MVFDAAQRFRNARTENMVLNEMSNEIAVPAACVATKDL